jgi:UDP-glucose 4-epimerase
MTDANKPRRILVTGAGGFLGTHICRHFGKQGWQVAAVGRFHTTLQIAETYPNLVLLGGMTLPDASFTRMVAGFKPDLVVHAAGTASVGDSVREPYSDFQRTVDVCAFVLETLRRHSSGSHFILLSSASVYGNPQVMPIDEGSAIAPISPYGFHKVMCEDLVREYQTLHGLKCAIARIFSAYGEGLKRQVIHDLCHKMHRIPGSSLELSGTGEESRDFIHAEDIARALDCIQERAATGIYNLGCGVETQIAEVARLVVEGFGTAKRPLFSGTSRPGDPKRWQSQIAKLTALGFRPQIALADGIRAYVRWYLNQEREQDAYGSWSPVHATGALEAR